MPTLYVCRGIPASGKSTYTRQMTVSAKGTMKRICKDELRLMLDGSHRFGEEHRQWLTKLVRVMTLNALSANYDVVLDETFVQRKDLLFIADWFFSNFRDDTFHVLNFATPFSEAVRRDSARHPSLGYNVLREYQDILESEGDTCSIMDSWRANSGRSIVVTTI